MNNIKEITLLINSIPDILQYFVPGYCATIIFLYIVPARLKKHSALLAGCIISYLSLAIVSLLRSQFIALNSLPDNALSNSALSFVVCIISSLFFAFLCTRKLSKSLFVRLSHKSLIDDMWLNVINYESGSNIKAYLKDKDYYIYGAFHILEEKDDASWLVLSGYEKRDKKTRDIYNDEPSFLNEDDKLFAVRLADIEYLEIL